MSDLPWQPLSGLYNGQDIQISTSIRCFPIYPEMQMGRAPPIWYGEMECEEGFIDLGWASSVCGAWRSFRDHLTMLRLNDVITLIIRATRPSENQRHCVDRIVSSGEMKHIRDKLKIKLVPPVDKSPRRISTLQSSCRTAFSSSSTAFRKLTRISSSRLWLEPRSRLR